MLQTLFTLSKNRLGLGKNALYLNFYAQTKGVDDDVEDQYGLSLKSKFATAQRACDRWRVDGDDSDRKNRSEGNCFKNEKRLEDLHHKESRLALARGQR